MSIYRCKINHKLLHVVAMTPDHIEKIEFRINDSLLKWNIMIAQADRINLLREVKELQAKLTSCTFCGGEVSSDGGGHTSHCYETMLNELRQENEILRAKLKKKKTKKTKKTKKETEHGN